MAELTPVGESLPGIVRPPVFATADTDRQDRSRKLAELVWAHVPNHLAKQPCRPAYARLVSEFDWRSSWILLGRTGAGKSTACVHLVRELLRRGRDNDGEDFVRAKSIFWTRADAITRAGGRDDEESFKLLHRAEHSRLMVLDDLASASKTMLGVIQQRYDAGRPMVVTSGAHTMAEFRELVGGDAVTRWILECGGVRKGTFLIGGER